MIIQAIALLDTLDKDINTFVMRVREWYSWHFPELVKLAQDNYQYSQLALLIKDKSTLSEEKLPGATLQTLSPAGSLRKYFQNQRPVIDRIMLKTKHVLLRLLSSTYL